MTSTGESAVPVFQDYMNPMLAVLRGAERPLSIEELDRRIVDTMDLAPDVVAVPHDPEKPDRSEVGYRIAWARTYLKKAGLIDNPRRGVWALTDRGRAANQVDARALASEVAREGKSNGTDSPADLQPEEDDEAVAGRVTGALASALRNVYEDMRAEGALLLPEEVERYYAAFRARFGPDVLASLDGEELLTTVHGRGKESLTYWLEFKNDDEFPAQFGGIGGGSALKFGIYQSAETKRWMTGKGPRPVPLSIADAIARVRSQRDQLVEGARVVSAFARDLEAADFSGLQARLQEVAPELAETSWGHKYFSLIAPTLIEPYHSAEHQRFQLIKMLKTPADGRYENARVFVGVARQLGLTLYELGKVLHRRNGAPHAYWRIRTVERNVSEWDRMQAGGFIGIDWPAVGDLSEIEHNKQEKDRIKDAVSRHYPNTKPAQATKAANQLFAFVSRLQERDIVLAVEKGAVRGIGRITGGYYYESSDGEFAHRRPVDWLNDTEWMLRHHEGMLQRLYQAKKPENLIEVEARLLGVKRAPERSTPPRVSTTRSAPAPLSGVVARIQGILQRKRQVILYGPPGTGKTYWADLAARELAARSWFGIAAEALDEAQTSVLQEAGAIESCTFHPAYGYEDFLEGFRPVEIDGKLVFRLRAGVFKNLCERARRDEKRNYYLTVDEINRGDIPRIFGELLTVLEMDKRGRPVTLPLSGETFVVPKNVFLIGTMNTADRSIALLDAALRRRFGFIELMPDPSQLHPTIVGGVPLSAWLAALNRRIVEHAGRDARNLQVGHAYLMTAGTPIGELPRFAEVLRDDIIPLLQEYCYEDFAALERILGSTLVSKEDQCLNDGLFQPGNLEQLAEAILSAFSEISTTTGAVSAEVERDLEAKADEDLDDEDPSEPGALEA